MIRNCFLAPAGQQVKGLQSRRISINCYLVIQAVTLFKWVYGLAKANLDNRLFQRPAAFFSAGILVSRTGDSEVFRRFISERK